jgi:hypothetical protein
MVEAGEKGRKYYPQNCPQNCPRRRFEDAGESIQNHQVITKYQ